MEGSLKTQETKSQPDVQKGLDDVGLGRYGFHLYRNGVSEPGAFICISGCRYAVRPNDILGHYRTHLKSLGSGNVVIKGEVKAHIMNVIDATDLLEDHRSVALPERVIAPFPFLKLYTDAYHCRYCSYCGTSLRTLRKHSGAHPEHSHKSVERRITKGCVQKFFPGFIGSAYFKVDPILAEVEHNSDFDIFFSSARATDHAQSQMDPSPGATGSEPWDMSPFLAKAGWSQAIQGYSLRGMRRRVEQLHKDEPSWLRKLRALGCDYLGALNEQGVHPAHLKRLNHWKS